MSGAAKKAFAAQVAAYVKRHGKMFFAFDDIHLPVEYHPFTGILATDVAGQNVSIVVDYSMNLDDNLQRLLDVLLERFPSLTD